MFPVTWTNQKRKSPAIDSIRGNARKKSKKNFHVGSRAIHTQLNQLMKSAATDTPTDITDIDIINSCVDVVETLPLSELMKNTETRSSSVIPVVSRVYEERYMRECKNKSERPCVMDKQCECMLIDTANGFVGVQFEIPGVENSDNTMCILCLRKTTTLLFYKTIYNGVKAKGVIQKHGNICNKENEYHPSVMLCCPVNGTLENMPVPIVAHQRNRYSVVTCAGVKFMKQNGVYMEDFR